MEFTPVHNQIVESIVDVICARTGNTDKAFFRPVVIYFLSKVASNMRANIVTKDIGIIPINNYAICLAPSGYGKNHSINILEDELLAKFKARFTKEFFKEISDENLSVTAEILDSYNHLGADTNLEILTADFAKCGEFVYSFDNGTTPAIKQLRNKLVMAQVGAISSEQDELGSNLTNNTDILNLMLELYDLGKVKQKLIKNTSENQRSVDLEGRVPTNLLMFGTPTKIFDGDDVESRFINFLETGYARRCIFGYGSKTRSDEYFNLSAREHFERKVNATRSVIIENLADTFEGFVTREYYNQNIIMPDELSIKLIEYRLQCEKNAQDLEAHEEIKKAELEHRYFKTLKLTGTLAFIKKHSVVEEEDLNEAITLIEESGESFSKFLSRDPNYVRLANFIADKKTEVTNADITEALPWYKTPTKRKELLTLARAWGYKNNLVIKEETIDGVEFFSASRLVETNLDKLIFSVSDQLADNYTGFELKFSNLDNLCIKRNLNWCNHQFLQNHRSRENVLNNFNCIVLDIDNGVSIDSFQDVFKTYKYYLYTTKRHTPENNRFRVIIPIKYELDLNPNSYKEFMTNVINSLPFDVDLHSCLPETKWSSYEGKTSYVNQEGELFDPLPFIPKTSRNREHNEQRALLKKLDKAQAWFISNINEGNRNNMLYRYAIMLVDNNKDYEEVSKLVLQLNRSIKFPLDESEIENTILRSVENKIHERRGNL